MDDTEKEKITDPNPEDLKKPEPMPMPKPAGNATAPGAVAALPGDLPGPVPGAGNATKPAGPAAVAEESGPKAGPGRDC